MTHRRASRPGLLLTTALTAVVLSLPARAQPAVDARPIGGQVVAGQASIAQTQARTTVNQASDRAAVNWQGFDVGANHTVQFAQPNANAVVLNRVVGPNPSEIAGRVEANGQVVIVNQAGVLFHKGAQIDTAGLVVSAAGISNSNFMAGRMAFDQPARPGAKVENRGTISIRDQGLAALVAPQVANSGVIRANMGTVVMAGAEAHTLDLYGDGMVSINVTRQVRTAPDGTPALVTNTGTILAPGGKVVLTAEAVDGVVQTLVNASGRIGADGRDGSRGGQVVVAGRGGNVIVAGNVTADGATTGGTVAVNATGTVALAPPARISASGPAGGGTVAIGTTPARAAGGPAVTGQPTARAVTIAQGATIAADATARGKGGVVGVLASDTTRMDGAIRARGGAAGGDGGAVEISGGRVTSATGVVDTSAPAGRVGSILLDPLTLTIIDAAGTQDGTFTTGNGTIAAADPSIPPDTLSNAVLNGFIGNVVLQADQSITVAANVALSGGAGQSLTLQAGGTIAVNTGVVVTAPGDIILAVGGAGPAPAPAAQPNPLIAVGGTLASTGGVVQLLGGAGGTISVASTGAVSGTGVTLAATGASAISVTGSVTATGAIGLNAGRILLADSALVAAPSLALGATTSIALNGSATLGRTGAGIDLGVSGGDLTQAATSRIIAATLQSGPGIGGNAALGGANRITRLGSFAATGSLTLKTLGALTVAGTASAGTTLSLNTGGVLKLGESGTRGLLQAGTVNLTAQAITAPNGGVSAGLLTATADSIDLTGANTIAALGTITASAGDLALANTTSLTIAGHIEADGNVRLQAAGAGGVVFATDAAVESPGIVTLRADALGNLGVSSASGEVQAAVFELAPATAGATVTLGTRTGLSLTSLEGISASIVRLGGTTTAGGSIVAVAGSIAVTGAFDAGGRTLDVYATGAVSQTAALLGVGQLRGSVGGPLILTHVGNRIDRVEGLSVTGAGKPMTIGTAGDLTASGLVFADGTLSLLTGPTRKLTVTGTVAAGGELHLTAGSLGLELGGASIVNGTTVALTSAAGITARNGALIGSTGVVVDLATAAGDVTAEAGAIVTAGTLRAGSGINGNLKLQASLNTIGAVGDVQILGAGHGMTLVTGTDVTLAGGIVAQGSVAVGTPTTQGISVTGGIDAGLIVLQGGSLAVQAGGRLAAAGIALDAQAGGISLAGGSRVGLVGSLVHLSATGGVTQQAGGILTAATLASPSGFGGPVVLAGTANAVARLEGIAVSGAGNGLTLRTSGGLVVAGAISAPGTIGLTAGGQVMVSNTISGGAVALTAGAGGMLLETGAIVQGPSASIDSAGVIALASDARLGQAGAAVRLSTTAGGVTQAAGAVLLAGTLASGGITGDVRLTGTANAVATLGSLAVTGGLTLANAAALAVAGPVTATGAIGLTAGGLLSTTGSIAAGTTLALTGVGLSLGGTVAAPRLALDATTGGIRMLTPARIGQAGATVSLAATTGVTQAAAAILTAGTLLAPATIGGDVVLAGTANAIASLGRLDVGVGSLIVVDDAALAVTGPITASGEVRLEANGLTVAGSISAGTTLALSARGSLSLESGSVLHAPSAALAATSGTGQQTRLAQRGDITQDGAARIEAGHLAVTATGDIGLAGTANAVAVLDKLSAGGDGSLRTAGAIAIAGPVYAGGAATIRAGGSIAVTGTMGAGTEVALTSGGAISLAGGAGISAPVITLAGGGPVSLAAGAALGQAGAVVDVSTTAGGFSADAASAVTAGLLTSASGITGDVTLMGTHAIGGIGALAATGAFALSGTQALVISGTLSAPSVFLRTTDPAGIAVAATGAVLATRQAGFQAAALTIASGGTIATKDFAFAPVVTGATLTLGLGGGLPALTGVTADRAVLGQVDIPGSGPVTTAGAITVTGSFQANGLPLHLLVGGPVTGTAGPVLDTPLITGTIAGSVDLTHPSNRIAGLGAFTVSGEGADLRLSSAVALAVSGGQSAPRDIGLATLSGAPLTLEGPIVAGRSLLADAAGSLGLGGSARLIGPAVVLRAGDGITMAAGAVAGVAGGTVDLSTTGGGISQDSDATLVAQILFSSLGIVGDATLSGIANAIGTIGALDVAGGGRVVAEARSLLTTGGNLSVVNAGALVIAGPVTAGGSIAVQTAGSLTVTGLLAANDQIAAQVAGPVALEGGAQVQAPAVTLSAAGAITLAAGAVLGQAGAIVDLSTSAGGVAQTPGGTILAGTVLSSGGITGAVNLPGSANAIDALGDIAVASGGFVLADSVPLALTGTLSATAISVTAPVISVTGRAVASDGAVDLAATAGALDMGGTISAAATVTLSAASGLTHDGTTAAGGDVTMTAGDDLAQAGVVNAGGSASLAASGAIDHGGTTQGVAGVVLAATTTISQAGTVSTQGAARITAGTALTHAGTTTATGAVDLAATTGALAQGGDIRAGTSATLTAGTSLNQGGVVSAGDSVTLNAKAGPLTQSGSVAAVRAAVLRAGGSMFQQGSVVVSGVGGLIDAAAAADITQVGQLTTSGAGSAITLAAPGQVSQSGRVTAAGDGSGVTITAQGNLSQTGTVAATGVGGSVSLASGATLTNAGIVGAQAGNVTLSANRMVLEAAGRITAGAAAAFTAATGLSNAGSVAAGNVTMQATTGTLTQAGQIQATQTARLAGAAGLSNTGTITVSATDGGLAIASSGGDAVQSGSLASGGSVTLAAAGAIRHDGAASAGAGGVSMTAGTAITQAAGRIAATGDVALAAGAEVLLSGGGIVADGAVRLRSAGSAISQSGGTIASGGATELAAAGPVTLASTITSGGDTAIAAGGAFVQAAGVVRAGGAVGITTSTAGIAQQQSGRIQAGGAVRLAASGGPITQAGSIVAGADASLSSAGAITQAGGVAAGNDAVLAARGPLTVTGRVQAGHAVALSAATADVLLAGTVLAGSGGIIATATTAALEQTFGRIASTSGSVALTAGGGSLRQSAVASLSAGTTATLNAATSITQAGSIFAGSGASLTAATGMTQSGRITAPGATVTLATADGAMVQTGLIEAGRIVFVDETGPFQIGGVLTGLTPSRLQAQAQFAIPLAAYPTAENDTGVYIVAGRPGGGATSQSITFTADTSATSGRPQLGISFRNDETAVLAVQGTSIDLFLSFLRGAATGAVYVGSLHVAYQEPGTAGTVDLTGTVNGLSGFAAAAASFIQPLTNASYILNGCAIQSFSCIQITSERPPVVNPLRDVQIVIPSSFTGGQVVLPDVAERDY